MKIVGDKVYLRAIETTDNQLLHELINDPETEKMVGGSSWPVSMEEQEVWQKSQLGRKDVLRCMIVEKDTDTPVGTIILSDIDEKNGVAQVHIKISGKFKGKGIGSDALNTIVRFAISELRMHCIYAEILSYNLASIRTFEKCGFSKEGVLRERVYKNGQHIDIISYSIMKKDIDNTNESGDGK